MSTSEKTLTLDKFPVVQLLSQKQQSKQVNVFSRLLNLLKRNSGVAQSTVQMEEKVTRELDRLSAYLPEEMLLEAKSRKEGLFADEVLVQKALFTEVAVESTFVRNFKLLMTCYGNPFNILLSVLAIISIATGDIATCSVMVAMVVISTVLRFWQEAKSLKKASDLLSKVTQSVRILRQSGSITQAGSSSTGDVEEIDYREIVPGDILVLSAGDLIVADSIIISSHSLAVSQSMVTGEVMPVDKGVKTRYDFEKDGEVEVIHRKNVLLSGTSVTSGECHAVAINVGPNSYATSIASYNARPINTFERSIRRISYLLLGFMGVMTPLVFLIQGFTNKQGGWKEAFLFSIAVAVGLTPEMLPLVVNANLARGAIAMARKNVIVKRLDGVQSLGGLTCFCTDKTGTLTVDAVEYHSSVSGKTEPSSLPFDLAFINSTLQTGTRSLLDKAVTTALPINSKIVDTSTLIKLGEVPFDSFRRLLTIYVAEPGSMEAILITKGAVAEVLERCTSSATLDDNVCRSGVLPRLSNVTTLDAATLAEIEQTADTLNEDGLRLIAVACRTVQHYRAESFDIEKEDERDLTFVGFIAFLDPPKPDALAAVQKLKELRVDVKILTGDAPSIALKVARQIGLLPSTSINSSTNPDVITGKQLTSLANGERQDFVAAVNRAVVFAKLSPYQKLEVIQALKEAGHSVGMLGDGVNDSLALRGADVGISVDTGSEIAKNAADIILLDKSLGTVLDGVYLGRMTLLNTVKYIKLAASSNFGNVFSILAASAWLPYQPIQPLQLLVQNMLYDFSQSSIPWDNVDEDYLVKPVRWSIWSVARFMIIFGPVSSIFDIVTFSINWAYYGIQTADDPLVSMAQTNWFLVGSTTQILVVYFLRTGKLPFVQSRPSTSFLLATLSFLGLGYSLPYIPKLNEAFSFTAPDPKFWGFIAAIAVTYCTLVQIVKVGYQKIWKEWL